MTRPDRDTTLMNVARVYEQRSTCSRNHVGAVISLDGRIITTGYNGAPARVAHCLHICTCNMARIDGARSPLDGEIHTAVCMFMRPCKVSVHAEANAIAFAAKHGLMIEGAELHTTLMPCYPCSQLIINAGLRRVVYDRTYRDESGGELLTMAGIEQVTLR